MSTVFDVLERREEPLSVGLRLDPKRSLLHHVCADAPLLEVIKLYSLDRIQQWNLDRPAVVRDFYARINRFLRRLHESLRRRAGRSWSSATTATSPFETQDFDLARALATLHVPRKGTATSSRMSEPASSFHAAIAGAPADRGVSLEGRRDEVAGFAGCAGSAFRCAMRATAKCSYSWIPATSSSRMISTMPSRTCGSIANRCSAAASVTRAAGNRGHLPIRHGEAVLLLLDGASGHPRHRNVLDVAPSLLEVLGCEPPPT